MYGWRFEHNCAGRIRRTGRGAVVLIERIRQAPVDVLEMNRMLDNNREKFEGFLSVFKRTDAYLRLCS